MRYFKSKWIYVFTSSLIVGFFTYAGYNGIAYWQSKVERNTKENNNHNRFHRSGYGYGGRFHHK